MDRDSLLGDLSALKSILSSHGISNDNVESAYQSVKNSPSSDTINQYNNLVNEYKSTPRGTDDFDDISERLLNLMNSDPDAFGDERINVVKQNKQLNLDQMEANRLITKINNAIEDGI